MNESPVTQLTPADEDPFVHRHLAALASFAPGEAFADRVMTRVWRPAPAWVRRTAELGRRVFSRKRVWAWTGGLAAASAISALLAIGLALTYSVQLETAWSVVAGGWLVNVWRRVLGEAVGMITALSGIDGVANIALPTLVGGALGAAAVMLVSGWGLWRVLQHSSGRAALYARR